MHKTLEHSDKDCAPSEDAPPLTFGVHFRLGGVCGCLQPTGSFVSHRPLTRTERTRNESQSEQHRVKEVPDPNDGN